MQKLKESSDKRLFKIAQLQEGYFTAHQAQRAGFIDANYGYHLRAENWIRVYRGIYRLANYPVCDNEQYILWYLWSMNRRQVPEGVYSHQTALSIYGLSDISPSKLHMTVPLHFRRSRIPKILVLHKSKLSKKDIIYMQGFAVTKPMKAILDLSKKDLIERGFILQALKEGIKGGLISKEEIKNALRSNQVVDWLKKIILQKYEI